MAELIRATFAAKWKAGDEQRLSELCDTCTPRAEEPPATVTPDDIDRAILKIKNPKRVDKEGLCVEAVRVAMALHCASTADAY